MARPPRNPSPDAQLPAWQRDSFFLDEVKGLAPFRLLEVSSHDDVALEQAVQAWGQMAPDIKEYLQARLDYNTLLGLDEIRRRLDRANSHSGSVRTGIRLLVQQQGGAPQSAREEDFGLGADDLPSDTGQVPMDEATLDEDLDPAVAMAALDALSNPQASAPKRKRAPAKRKGKGKSNGVVSGEILDAEGNPVQPPA